MVASTICQALLSWLCLMSLLCSLETFLRALLRDCVLSKSEFIFFKLGGDDIIFGGKALQMVPSRSFALLFNRTCDKSGGEVHKGCGKVCRWAGQTHIFYPSFSASLICAYVLSVTSFDSHLMKTTTFSRLIARQF